MKYFHILVFSVLLFSACTEHGNVTEVGNTGDTTVIWLDSLERIDQDLLVDEEMNKEKGWKAFGAFRKFARENPDHPLAPTYHMKAAAIARNIPGKALMAIDEYSTVYKKYPNDSLAAQAYFLIGFTFDQSLNDRERALKAYKAFVKAYPNHTLTAQTQDLIAMLESGDDDLEQVEKWEKEAAKKN